MVNRCRIVGNDSCFIFFDKNGRSKQFLKSVIQWGYTEYNYFSGGNGASCQITFFAECERECKRCHSLYFDTKLSIRPTKRATSIATIPLYVAWSWFGVSSSGTATYFTIHSGSTYNPGGFRVSGRKRRPDNSPTSFYKYLSSLVILRLYLLNIIIFIYLLNN